MKKTINNILILIILLSGIFVLTGCEKKQAENEFVTATLNSDGDIVVDSEDISTTATFINYEADDTVIQLIAVKASDGTVRLAFNTCQVCNPSPKAYFVQEGDYFVCQNCKNKFKTDELGIIHGGCNPTPVEEKKDEEEKIIINKDYILEFKEKFENWEGPTE